MQHETFIKTVLHSLEIFLFDLHEADQSKNKDLWDELLQALSNNPHLLHEDYVLEFFDRPYFVEDAYWCGIRINGWLTQESDE